MQKEKQIIECVPNYSEGRDMSIIKQITDAIESVEGVSLLNVDPGEATNRTVVTFVGEPEAVVEAAFRGAKKAGEVIDMRKHHGAHPRMGATDVLPLIPVAGITLEECAELARKLAERMAREAGIPCYAYEASAFRPERKNLAVCRAGEYEALEEKLTNPDKRPDFMPESLKVESSELRDSSSGSKAEGSKLLTLNPQLLRTGCTAVGARDFLIAVNWNLNTTSTRRANAIAFDVREKGRPVREGNPITGTPKRDADGNIIFQPGTLKATKAIGWYIDEYGIAQVSMNMTNLNVTPLHVAFDEVCRCAQNRGIRVTGTEIVGLVPKRALIDAGKYFLEKQHRSVGIPEEDIIQMAVKSMGLDDLKPFNPREKVIEYLMEDRQKTKDKKLIDLTVDAFAKETSRESPAPGGGTVAAYMGALAAALGTMVANLSSHKAGWDDRWQEFSVWADKGQKLLRELLSLVDEDTEAFNRIMAAFGLPKKSEAEKAARTEAIQAATLYATQVPLHTMKASLATFELCKAMAQEGNPASVSDAGVGALAARAAVLGAALNVKINAASLNDRSAAEAFIAEANALAAKANEAEREILAIVESKL
jgi:glutamate formiminotransferase/formiminotetrahydrofolate cyclodeaminase